MRAPHALVPDDLDRTRMNAAVIMVDLPGFRRRHAGCVPASPDRTLPPSGCAVSRRRTRRAYNVLNPPDKLPKEKRGPSLPQIH